MQQQPKHSKLMAFRFPTTAVSGGKALEDCLSICSHYHSWGSIIQLWKSNVNVTLL